MTASHPATYTAADVTFTLQQLAAVPGLPARWRARERESSLVLLALMLRDPTDGKEVARALIAQADPDTLAAVLLTAAQPRCHNCGHTPLHAVECTRCRFDTPGGH